MWLDWSLVIFVSLTKLLSTWLSQILIILVSVVKGVIVKESAISVVIILLIVATSFLRHVLECLSVDEVAHESIISVLSASSKIVLHSLLVVRGTSVLVVIIALHLLKSVVKVRLVILEIHLWACIKLRKSLDIAFILFIEAHLAVSVINLCLIVELLIS